MIEAVTLSDSYKSRALFCYLQLTYLSLPNACLCKVLAGLAFGAGQVRLVSQALPEREVGSKFMSLRYYCKHVERLDILLVLWVFSCVSEYSVDIIFHYFCRCHWRNRISGLARRARSRRFVYSELLA